MLSMLGLIHLTFMSVRGIHSLDLQSLVPYPGEGDKEVAEVGVEAGMDARWRLERNLEQGRGERGHRP